jgi:hypothetical protein
MSDFDDEEYDKYENKASGDHAPVVSWKGAPDGATITGIVLPPKPLDRPDKGYENRREYKQENKQAGTPAGYTVWPPKNNKQKMIRPVTEEQFQELWPDLWPSADNDVRPPRKVWQVHITLQTGLTNGEFISRKTLERMKDADVDPATETRRRIIEQGKSLTDEIAAALKKVGGKPIPGQIWEVRLKTRVPNEFDGETRIHEVKVSPPTAETRAVVAEYVAKAKAAADAEADAKDPDDKYGAPAASQEEPPF